MLFLSNIRRKLFFSTPERMWNSLRYLSSIRTEVRHSIYLNAAWEKVKRLYMNTYGIFPENRLCASVTHVCGRCDRYFSNVNEIFISIVYNLIQFIHFYTSDMHFLLNVHFILLLLVSFVSGNATTVSLNF